MIVRNAMGRFKNTAVLKTNHMACRKIIAGYVNIV